MYHVKIAEYARLIDDKKVKGKISPEKSKFFLRKLEKWHRIGKRFFTQ
jgi:hypothetical protein